VSFDGVDDVPDVGPADSVGHAVREAITHGTGLVLGVEFDTAEDGAIRIRSRDPRMITVVSCLFDETHNRYLVDDGALMVYPESMRGEFEVAKLKAETRGI
jgi:hypothetical protein